MYLKLKNVQICDGQGFFFEIEDGNGFRLRMLEKMIGCPIPCLHNDSYLVYTMTMGN